MVAPNPRPRTISEVKSKLLSPALTSHYELYMNLPNSSDFNSVMQANGINYAISQDNIQLACSEATLPGSSLATHEITGDYTGVTERHAYRRIYDDRIDLTFYVDTNYTVIRFFETWIKYIVSESISPGSDGRLGLRSPNYFYTVRYPQEYQTEFSITKFEKTGYNNFYNGSKLVYTFMKAYPISITSMPVSYETSSLLKCTISFNYTRYFIESLAGSPAPASGSPQATLGSNLTTPLQQGLFNADSVFINPEFGIDTTGGLSISNALSSGNSIQQYEGDEIIGAINSNQRPVEAGLPYVGRNVGPIAPFSGI